MKTWKLLFLGIIGMIFLSGCDLLKRDSLEDINIITTSYPLEYIIKSLYGKHSLVQSIYPDGENYTTYPLNDQLLDTYSKEKLFVYVSYGNDKDIAVKLRNKNKNLLMIDGSLGMSPDYIEELWLNPSNLLMVAQNVKNGLTQYISNNYLIKEIDKNYQELELKLSELDAEIKLTAENAPSKTIVVATSSLNYLKKYGFQVISLDQNNSSLDKNVKEVTDMIESGKIKYIYTLEKVENNETVKLLLENNASLSQITLKRLDSITEEERDNQEDYFKLMNHNLEQIKKETYK